MPMTLCRCCCFRFRFLSLSLSLCLCFPFRPFRHSPAIIFIFFGNILHFIRHSAVCTFTLSLLLAPGIDVSTSTWSSSGASRCVPALGGLLMRILTEYALTHTRSHTQTHSGTLIHPHIDTHVRNVSAGWRPLWMMLIFSYFSAPNEKCILCKERVVVTREGTGITRVGVKKINSQK